MPQKMVKNLNLENEPNVCTQIQLTALKNIYFYVINQLVQEY